MQIISRALSIIVLTLVSFPLVTRNQFQARHFYDDEDDEFEGEGEYEYENEDESQYDDADGSDGYGGNPPMHRGAMADAEGRHDYDDQGEADEAEDDNEEYEDDDKEAYLSRFQPQRQQQQQQQQQHQRVAEQDEENDDDEAEYEARYLAELAHEQRENVRLRAMVCPAFQHLVFQCPTHVAIELWDPHIPMNPT